MTTVRKRKKIKTKQNKKNKRTRTPVFGNIKEVLNLNWFDELSFTKSLNDQVYLSLYWRSVYLCLVSENIFVTNFVFALIEVFSESSSNSLCVQSSSPSYNITSVCVFLLLLLLFQFLSFICSFIWRERWYCTVHIQRPKIFYQFVFADVLMVFGRW